MTATLIATTSMRDLQPLGIGGRLAMDAAEALAALLRRTLTTEHAALFAEPHANAARGEVDWYAEGTGVAIPLGELPPERAAPIRAELQRLADDIRAEIVRLRAAAGEGERFLAEMLDLALRIPDEGAIRVRDGRPVLVGWGHQRLGTVAGEPVLGRIQAPPVPMAILPPPVLPPPAGARLWPWAVALGCALLLLGAASWYGWSVTGAPAAACRIDPAAPDALAAWRQTDARNAGLRAELAALLNEAGQRRLQCAATAAPMPPAGRDPRRAQIRGAHTGKLQIILAWDDTNDLDLHVTCPDGEHLFFENRHACGGELDVDANSEPLNTTGTPVESAFWAVPGPGVYKVEVAAFTIREAPQSPFRITVRQEGQPDRVQAGMVGQGQPMVSVLTVTVPGGAAP